MEILNEGASGAAVVRLPGPLTLANAREIRSTLVGYVEARGCDLLLDLQSVPFVDSSGLSAILACANAARRRGRRVALTGVGGRVRALVEMTRLDDVVDVLDEADDTRRWLASEPS